MSSYSPQRACGGSYKLGRLPFPSPVLDDLWVEGDGPGHEVDPANHLVYDANNSAVYHQELDSGAGLVGVISMQINSHLSNILRSHLERGIFLSTRHYNLLGRLNLICGHV